MDRRLLALGILLAAATCLPAQEPFVDTDAFAELLYHSLAPLSGKAAH